MAETSISSTNSTTKTSSVLSTSKSSMPGMDSDAFMQVLLAQLRHQNPLEPMNDKELIGQMAQLNSLQELQKINTTLETLVEVTQTMDTEEG